MTNRLLDATLISIYDYSKMSKEVKKIFSTLNLMRIKYESVPLPIITPTYEIRYSAPTKSTTSKVEDYVIKKISKEEDLNKYIDKIVSAMKKLNKEEMIVFSETFINGLDDQNITSKLETTLYDGYKNKEENEIPLEIILSITTNKEFTNDKDRMFNFLEKIIDQGITFDDYEDVREKVSKYLRSEDRELDKISGILEKLNKEESDYFIDMLKKNSNKFFSYEKFNIEELQSYMNKKNL